MTKSTIFSNYNALQGAVSEGFLDRGRVNRALGVAQRREPRPYDTTPESCSCPDQTFHPWLTCKHRLALFLKEIQ